MQPYTICYLLLFLSTVFSLKIRSQKIQILLLLLPFIALFLFSINKDYGPDMPAYKVIYERLSLSNFLNDPVEKGYGLSNALFQWLGFDFKEYVNISFLFTFFVTFYFFKKYSPYVALSWMIYFVTFWIYQGLALRQAIAMAIILLSYKTIVNNKLKRFLLYICLATSFHFSALLFLPAYFIAKLSIQRKTAFLLITCFVPLLFFNLQYLLEKVAILIGVPNHYIALYLKEDALYLGTTGFSLGIIFRLLFFIFYAYSYDAKDKIQKIWFNLFLFYTLASMLLSSVVMLAGRGLDYYRIIECIFIPITILQTKDKILSFVLWITILLYTSYALSRNFNIPSLIPEYTSPLKTIINNL